MLLAKKGRSEHAEWGVLQRLLGKRVLERRLLSSLLTTQLRRAIMEYFKEQKERGAT